MKGRGELIIALTEAVDRIKEEGNPQSEARAVVALVAGIDEAAKKGHWQADVWHLASRSPGLWGPTRSPGVTGMEEFTGEEYGNLISALKTAGSDEELHEALHHAAERDWEAAARVCEVAWPDQWGPISCGEVELERILQGQSDTRP